MKLLFYGFVLVGSTLLVVASNVIAEETDWARFRGANGNGRVESANVPESWSESKNLLWKSELPGPGSSSPIAYEGRTYLTCYTGYGESREVAGNPADLKRHLLCFDMTNGKELWRSSIDSSTPEDKWEGFIQEHGFASSTPATNGKQIFVQCGKSGLVAFDMEGNQLWQQELGTKSDPAAWGDGTSPIIWNNLVIVNAGITGHRIVAFEVDSGREVWKYENDKLTNSWATPIIVNANDRNELVCAAPGRIFALDPGTGKEYWTCASPIAETVCASLVEHDGAVFLMGGRAGNAIGVRCGGEGDVSGTHTLWQGPLRSGIGTPVIVGGRMFWSSQGLMFCASCETGEQIYRERLPNPPSGGEGGERRGPSGDYASPIAVGDNVLIVRRSGQAIWIKASDSFKPGEVSSFDSDRSQFNGTPAVAGNSILIRSDKWLYCVGNRQGEN